MHEIQAKLLQLAETQDLGDYTFRKLGDVLGGAHPYKVQHHLEQLFKKGLLVKNKRTGAIKLVKDTSEKFDGLLSIPVLGQANCGPAVSFADDQLIDFLRVSSSVIQARQTDNLFALRAVGTSMNRANIAGQSIDDGDYVIVNKSDWSEVKNGDYIVALYDDCANIKRLYIDNASSQILLVSESKDVLHPIIIAKEDLDYFRVSGQVIQVLKNQYTTAVA